MKKIPTAEEFLNKENLLKYFKDENPFITDMLKVFAKLHVEKQLKSILEKIELVENCRSNGEIVEEPFNKEYDFYIREDSIKNAYPLENIK